MSKKPDRIFIEAGDRAVYNNLEARAPLKGLRHITVFCLAMGFGYKEGIKTPLKKKDGFIMYTVIKESEWRLIKAVAVGDTGNLAIVGDISECAAIAEEYANSGLHLIREMVESTKTGELETTIERIIIDQYKKLQRELDEKTKNREKQTKKSKIIQELLDKGEGPKLEFKSSLRWDVEKGVKNNDLEAVIAKGIVGFLNARGGTLVVGVGDGKQVLGIENDYSTCLKKNSDGFELRLREVVDEYIGVEFGNLIEVEFESIEGKEVCIVKISESPRPVYLQTKNRSSEFILRDGNRTIKLDPKKIEEYRKGRWT